MMIADVIEDPVYIVFIVLEIWAFISSVVGNSLVLYVMTREKKLRRQSNYHIISVAVSNLLFGAIGIPFSVYAAFTGGPESYEVCYFLSSFVLGTSIVSIFSLLVVSLDRYFAICHALFHRGNVGKKVTLSLIAFCWSLGVLGFLPLFGWNSGLFTDKCDARITFNFDYIIFLCVTVSLIPTILLIIVYVMIFKKIIELNKSCSTASTDSLSDREARAAKTLSMAVSSFLICWLPVTLIFFGLAISEDRTINEKVWNLCIIVSHFHSGFYPLIYAYRIRDVRNALKSVLTCGRHSSA